MRNTVGCKVSFHKRCFVDISSQCKNFIRGLLRKVPDERPTSTGACDDAWLQAGMPHKESPTARAMTPRTRTPSPRNPSTSPASSTATPKSTSPTSTATPKKWMMPKPELLYSLMPKRRNTSGSVRVKQSRDEPSNAEKKRVWVSEEPKNLWVSEEPKPSPRQTHSTRQQQRRQQQPQQQQSSKHSYKGMRQGQPSDAGWNLFSSPMPSARQRCRSVAVCS